MHLAAALGIAPQPAACARQAATTLAAKSAAFAGIVKIGRTHLQDATPLTLGQEFSGYVAQLEHAEAVISVRAALALPAGHRRHGGRHRPQHASGVRRPRRGRTRRRTAACPLSVRPTSSPRWPHTTAWSPRTAR
jgi:hypothetical protein